jgi:alkylhydroperoxidase family enzyme
MSDGCGCGANGCEHIDAEGLARLLSAGSALAEAMKVALPWLELRANYDTVVACGAALTAWEEATKGRDLAAAPASGVVTCAHGVAICMACATDDYTADVGAPLDGKGEEGSKP